jgi:hypothetical protein
VQRKLNWFGLAGGATTIILIAVSLFVPWWQFQVGTPTSADGQPLLVANVSPLNTNFGGMGDSFSVPLIWALNLASVLTMLSAGIIMIIYSVLPNKPYAMKLLSFSYRKPLYSVVFFVISLFALSVIVNSILGFGIPLMGTANVQVSQALSGGASVSMLVSAEFLWPFWMSIAVAAFCLIARVYHKKLIVAPLPIVLQPVLLKEPQFPLQQKKPD